MMDPNACLTRLLNALRDKHRDEAMEALTDLKNWVGNGGFLPDDPKLPNVDDVHLNALIRMRPHRTRHDDALFAQSGACNPRALALSLFRHMCHVTEELGGTDGVRNDPALRLITHQLSYLMGLEFGWSANGYEEAMQAVADKASPEIVTICAPAYARAPN